MSERGKAISVLTMNTEDHEPAEAASPEAREPDAMEASG
jgi:hypothetical protein